MASYKWGFTSIIDNVNADDGVACLEHFTYSKCFASESQHNYILEAIFYF